MRTPLRLVALAVILTACSSPEVSADGDQGAQLKSSKNADGGRPSAPSATDETSAGADEGMGVATGGSDMRGMVQEDAGPPRIAPIAKGLSVSEVAVFQGVKITVAKAGQTVTARKAPVVANRGALVRVYVAPSATWTARNVIAELTLGGATPFTLTKVIGAASTDENLESTFNFEVPADALPVGVKYSVTLRDPSGSDSAEGDGSAQFPAGGGEESLGTASSGAQLKIVIAPIAYSADGSGRLPDVSPAQVERFRNQMLAIYPASKIDISVRAASIPWSQDVLANTSGWTTLLNKVISVRQADGAAPDTYYYGLFLPGASFNAYCGTTCMTGLSPIAADASDASVRASIGLGFNEAEAPLIMAHEIGHAHGRAHAPCGAVAAPDPAFPYSGGSIGSWGYNIITKQLISPTDSKDWMGYCRPAWVSDYNYKQLFDRMKAVNAVSFVNRTDAPRAYRFTEVDASGDVRWGSRMMLRTAPSSSPRALTFTEEGGGKMEDVTAFYYPYGDLPGGLYLVPEGSTGSLTASIPDGQRKVKATVQVPRTE